jgi:bifunctional non-homologous end joining protein LigD
MLASRGARVPTGPEWLHEVKWDGMRVLAEVRDGAVRLWSRNENDVTVSFPELASEPVLPGHEALLDGEVVALAADGVPRFSALGDRMHVSSPARARLLARGNPVTLMAFDVLRLDGRDLTGDALSARREVLSSLGLGAESGGPARWQVPPTYDDGLMLQAATEQQGLEGIVSKKRSSRYFSGRRTRDWLKFPNRPSQSYVVGGWRPETTSAARLGAVLVGTPTAQGLSYRGRVGSGLTGRTAQALLEQLGPLRVETSPFCDEVPRVDAAGTVWVRPEVVVDVASLGVTDGGRLRQPSFQGVRPDLDPSEVGT